MINLSHREKNPQEREAQGKQTARVTLANHQKCRADLAQECHCCLEPPAEDYPIGSVPNYGIL